MTHGRDSLPVDVEQALRIKMAHALAGGYDSGQIFCSRSQYSAWQEVYRDFNGHPGTNWL